MANSVLAFNTIVESCYCSLDRQIWLIGITVYDAKPYFLKEFYLGISQGFETVPVSGTGNMLPDERIAGTEKISVLATGKITESNLWQRGATIITIYHDGFSIYNATAVCLIVNPVPLIL